MLCILDASDTIHPADFNVEREFIKDLIYFMPVAVEKCSLQVNSTQLSIQS